MQHVSLPLILEPDYHMFWRILYPELPSHYEDWLASVRSDEDRHVRRGHTPQGVAVKPDEFAEYCRLLKVDADLNRLFFFAADKSRQLADDLPAWVSGERNGADIGLDL